MTDTTTTTPEADETPEEPTKAVERIVGELQKKLGDISYSDLLDAVAPKPKALAAPAAAPLPAEITPKQKAALAKLPKVFGKVVPTTRRALEPAEVGKLLDEREVLDEIDKMVGTRKEGIKTSVNNHLDVEVEQKHEAERDEGDDSKVPKGVLYDKHGHLLVGGEARAPKHETMFRRELRKTSPMLSPEALNALAEDESFESFNHDDYLAMTTQTRVLDENKVMLALRKNPKLLLAVAKATTPADTPQTASLNIRKA